MQDASPPPPLNGVRVVDFSRIIAGPLCTQQLADLGADVIKIENPQSGDDTRRQTEPGIDGQSHFFLAFNRSKRSLALDVRTESGRDVVLKLLEQADVLVQNFRPGVMERLGLGYDALRERFPKLIYVSISAYGQVGPMSDRPGFDPVLQAESGMMSLTGEPDGPPLRHPLSIVDTMTALQAVGAINAALFARQTSGRGQMIDLALFDVAVAALGNAGLYYLCSGELPARSGNSHMTSTPTNLFDTENDPIYMALGTDRLYRQLCEDVLDRPELADDPRFKSSADRLLNRPELFTVLRDAFGAAPREHWLKKMRHLPAGPVRTVGDALDSEEVAAREMVTETLNQNGNPVRLLGSPIKLSDSPLRDAICPPELGADTDSILADLGVDSDTIAQWRQSGIIR